MSYEVRVFYKTGDLPESFILESDDDFAYADGMLMMVDTKKITYHITKADIERVEIEEIREDQESE